MPLDESNGLGYIGRSKFYKLQKKQSYTTL
jgi:hypothetical protein